MDAPFEEQGLRDRVGMVMPAWFGPEVPEEQIAELLRHTLAGSQRLARSDRIVLVVDGVPRVETVARRLQEEWAQAGDEPFVVFSLAANLGKGAAVAAGLSHLIQADPPAWCLTRDADGDHRVTDMPRLVALGEQIAAEQGTDLVAVIGGRQSLYRPMNWLRGELEYWLDEAATEAYKFALARQGQALNTQYWAAYGVYPDLESGCKCFSAAAARLAAEALEREAGRYPELDLLQWACEIIPLTEIAVGGGVIGEMRRLTYEGQPVSGYEGESEVVLYANQMVWLAHRLELTRRQAAQILDNALLRRPLWSDGQGRQIALGIRGQVLEGLSGEDAPGELHAARWC
jgi:hypothetical protein